jgi:hypothetical protein
MFSRELLNELNNWKEKKDRKPLILRGARQVGKTTLVNMLAESFDQYVYLNLERPEDLGIFDPSRPFYDIIAAIFFLKGKSRQIKSTLIFIDEIQNSPVAVGCLRYFYEDAPEIHVIAAGSLLESLIENRISFPVGRVEYMALHPCSFSEFLSALGETGSLEILQQFPVPDFAHDQLLRLFNQYTLIGGMPEIIKNYMANRDLTMLSPNYDSLIVSYMDDVEKYARNPMLLKVIRHIINSAFQYYGSRITFERFGNSNYRSREVSEAFRTLEKSMLLQLVYPTESPMLPLTPNYRKSPKLIMLDTGLVNYVSKIQKEVFIAADLTEVYKGRVAEHIVGQELMAKEISVLSKLNFWTREQKNSQAEVDFVVTVDGNLIPVEVKSGGSGKIKSLKLFMDLAPDQIAVRFWSGKTSVEKMYSVSHKPFTLINLPLYLAGNIREILHKIIDSGPGKYL